MTATADAFVTQLRASAPALKAWAAYVVKQVSDMLLAEIDQERYKTFFKVGPSFRLKDEASAVKKLAKKNYENPFEQMIDLVGARFVVLLRTDLDLLEQVMISHTGWNVSRERHYDYEAESDPEVFDYQSVHFLLRSVGEETRDGVLIPDGTVCEVQIRTVLQHAYAELCHDRIYKTTGLIPSSAKRLVARCMALMETTDLMFCEAAKELEQVSADRAMWINFLTTEYFDITKKQAAVYDPTCAQIVDVYLHLLNGVKMTDVSDEVAPQPLRAKILGRAGAGLFASPACILCYWLVKNHHTELLRTWPNEALRADFEQVCADLGYAH
jgi:putative GTP pyrophosphokinase